MLLLHCFEQVLPIFLNFSRPFFNFHSVFDIDAQSVLVIFEFLFLLVRLGVSDSLVLAIDVVLEVVQVHFAAGFV